MRERAFAGETHMQEGGYGVSFAQMVAQFSSKYVLGDRSPYTSENGYVVDDLTVGDAGSSENAFSRMAATPAPGGRSIGGRNHGNSEFEWSIPKSWRAFDPRFADASADMCAWPYRHACGRYPQGRTGRTFSKAAERSQQALLLVTRDVTSRDMSAACRRDETCTLLHSAYGTCQRSLDAATGSGAVDAATDDIAAHIMSECFDGAGDDASAAAVAARGDNSTAPAAIDAVGRLTCLHAHGVWHLYRVQLSVDGGEHD